MKNRGFSKTILIVIVVIVIIVVGYFVWKEKDSTVAQVTPPTSVATTTATSGWSIYSNTQLGFSFEYPSTWQVSEKIDNSGNSYVDLSSGIFSEPQLPTVPSEEIQFSVVSASYFNPPIGTKVGMIGYDSSSNQLVDTSEPSNCFSRPLLVIAGAPSVFFYDGSMMSTPAHENYAILTKNKSIILVTELSLMQPDQTIDSQIAKSFTLLNGNTIVSPTCSATQ